MFLSPIPAFSGIRLHAPAKAGRGDSRTFQIGAKGRNQEKPGRVLPEGFDTVAGQVAQFGTSAVLEARAGAPDPEGGNGADGATEKFINPLSLAVGLSAAETQQEAHPTIGCLPVGTTRS